MIEDLRFPDQIFRAKAELSFLAAIDDLRKLRGHEIRSVSASSFFG